MNRYFLFKWKTNKMRAVERRNLIIIPNATGDIGVDCHMATNLFCKTFGNLKKNDIIWIQELDKNGDPIGELITPMDDTAIIPVKK